jgi:acyl-lipid omega-6 desaturase (Delta-12 desaturase)
LRSLHEIINATHEFAHEERALSWWYFLSSVSLLLGALLVTALPLNAAFRIVASLCAGLVLMRVFILYHDCEHGAIFRNSRFGKLLTSIVGFAVLKTPADWSSSHNHHHKKNALFADSAIGSYSVKTTHEYAAATSFKRWQYRFVRSPLIIFFGYFTVFFIENGKKAFYRNCPTAWQARGAMLLHAALYVVLIKAGWDYFLLCYFLPLFLSCAFGSYLFYAQHYFPEVKFKPDSEWDYGYAALHSSSYLEAGPLMHWITGNIGYHHIHHLNPKIPFYKLPLAMKAIPELQNPGRTSLWPREILRCLRLKLWDPQLNRMVDFQGR